MQKNTHNGHIPSHQEGGSRNRTENDLEQPNKSMHGKSRLFGAFPGRSTGVVLVEPVFEEHKAPNYQLKSSASIKPKEGAEGGNYEAPCFEVPWHQIKHL